MPESNSDLTAIYSRLQKLEHTLRLWKIVAVIAFVLLGTFSITWYLAEQDALSTERFVLLDKQGKERATLGLDAEGAPSLVFYNNSGRVVALLASKPDGSAAFTLQSADGTTLFKAP